MKGASFLSILFIAFFCACSQERERSRPSFPFKGAGVTKLLGHRGGGAGAHEESYKPNSLEAVRYGLKELDGVEIDLQLSKDCTIWVFHDHELMTCEGNKVNINELNTSTIEEIGRCMDEKGLLTFRGLMEDLRGRSNSGQKILSLDMKGLKNPVALRRFGGKRALADLIASRLRSLIVRSTHFRFFIEIPFPEQFEAFDTLSKELFYLVGPDQKRKDVHQILQDHEVGLSASLAFAEDHLDDTGGSEGLSVGLQLWTTSTGDELRKVLRYDPLAVQTDHVQRVRLAEQMDKEGARYHEWNNNPRHKVKGSYSMVLKKELKKRTGGFFLDMRFFSPHRFTSEELLLVVSIGEKGDEERYWRSIKVEKGKQRILRYVPEREEGEMLKVYFWVRGEASPAFEKFRIGSWSA